MRNLRSDALTRYALLAALALVTACPQRGTGRDPGQGAGAGSGELAKDGDGLGKKANTPPLPAEAAPPATARLADTQEAALVGSRIQSYFEGNVGRRFYIQLDKPLYKPGETAWVKVWDLTTRSLAGDHPAGGLLLELRNPKGAVVMARRVQEQSGAGQADFEIAAGSEGGEYTVRATSLDGHPAEAGERPLIVSNYEPPRLKMKLEFVRKAYGAGDEVSATIDVKRPTGEPLKNHPLSALVRLDGQDLPRVELTTNGSGEGLVKFRLPPEIRLGDGLLTVLADDGGLTESIAKRVPILLKKLVFSVFPEGGQLIEGLNGRVYFEAKTPLGKPADVSGRIVDDHGATLARFESVRDGLGRIEFTPSTGRTYHIEVEKPVGITEQYPVPLAAPSGCMLHSFDDLDGELEALRVSVRCSEPRKVIVAAMLRENFIDSATVQVPKDGPAVVYLAPKGQGPGPGPGPGKDKDKDKDKGPGKDGAAEKLARAQGVARVTVFDDKLNPLAERLVYRNRRSRLNIKVEPSKAGRGYAPRDQVTLEVTTSDPSGQPRPAELALAVVDDTVLSFADDKTGHMLSRLYLESELADKVEEPNFYFDLTEAKSALAMDLLMGTRGWRKFEWQPVLNPAPALPVEMPAMGGGMANDFGGLRKGRPGAIPPPAPPMDPLAAPPPVAPPKPMPRPEGKPEPKLAEDAKALRQAEKRPEPMPVPREMKDEAKNERPAPTKPAAMPVQAAQPPMAEVAAGPAAKQKRLVNLAGERARRMAPPEPRAAFDRDDIGGLVREEEAPPVPAWAPVRVFPAPTYRGDYSGPRTDFRETIHWQPIVATGKDGKATVTFYLSDAVTSFRIISEGVGGGIAGRDETVIKSSLPFSMAVKLPVEVSAQDKIRLPLVLTNEREKPLAVDLEAHFGDLLTLDKPVDRTSGTLAAQARDALFYPLSVAGKQGNTEVRFVASAGGLRDEFVRELRVTPLGFPQQLGRSGQVQGMWSQELDLGSAQPGTIDGALKLYPSPVSTMISGLDGMLQEPNGCFEQTSSTNYPNVMILRYLKQHNVDDPRVIERAARLIGDGYKRLVSFETKEKGYEWFGSTPPHEALTAYGLVEFVDMKEIFDVDSEMLGRTAAWLRTRRDGKGGYQRDPKSIDSFGSASPEVTNAYITYALTEAHQADLEPEIDASARVASDTHDAYLLALTSNTLLNSGRKQAGRDAARRLAAMQEADGAFTKADHSITRSGGQSLHIETTALAAMALIKAGGFDDPVRRAVEWMTAHRGGFGAWGATQSTVLALKAVSAYAAASARMASEGEVTLTINGQRIATLTYEAGHREPLVFDSLGQYLKPGKNQLELRSSSASALPFTLGVEYRALTPATSPEAKIDLATELERSQVKAGESVRLNVTVTNKVAQGQPMTLARVGIPGGLSFQTWQLKELRDKGLVAFYETQPREVILYLREMKPSEVAKLPLDLLATVPGDYRAPASSAYLYYTNEHKTWVDGTRIAIEP